MYHVARNAVHDQGRSSKRTIKHYELDEYAQRVSGGSLADEQIQKKQELRALQNAMGHLSTESREVLILSRYQELKYHEIAKIMDITEGAVKVRVHRALHQLKNIYQKIESNEM